MSLSLMLDYKNSDRVGQIPQHLGKETLFLASPECQSCSDQNQVNFSHTELTGKLLSG